MDFLEIMQTYFRGERTEAFFYILPAGLLLLGMAATAVVSDRGGFGWGMGGPLVLGGLLFVVVGISVGARAPAQVEQLERAYEEDPAAMLAQEVPRMEAVNANWPRIVTIWAAFVVVGLVIRFASSAEWAHGVGPALIMIGAIGLFVDGYALRRAQPYTAALDALAAETAAAPGTSP
ncbi:MAG: hypothetical protein AB1Z98_11315 [Nannocystaceae bacterium]